MAAEVAQRQKVFAELRFLDCAELEVNENDYSERAYQNYNSIVVKFLTLAENEND